MLPCMPGQHHDVAREFASPLGQYHDVAWEGGVPFLSTKDFALI